MCVPRDEPGVGENPEEQGQEQQQQQPQDMPGIEFLEAAVAALHSHGAGVSSVRFICGTQNIHKVQ